MLKMVQVIFKKLKLTQAIFFSPSFSLSNCLTLFDTNINFPWKFAHFPTGISAWSNVDCFSLFREDGDSQDD